MDGGAAGLAGWTAGIGIGLGRSGRSYYDCAIRSGRPLAIQAVGVFTSAGPSVATALGSARLGLKFFEELPYRDAAGNPIVGARTPLDLGDVAGVERLVTMALIALGECTGPKYAAPLLLCLPEPVANSFAPAGLLAILCGESGGRLDPAASRVFALGRASVFDALEEADRLLSTRAARAVYLGGVDSFIDRRTLDSLLRAGQLQTSTTEGFVPGEGAAFLRLAAAPDAGTLALIASVARTTEPCTRASGKPNTGEALAQAGRAAMAAAATPVTAIGGFIHDAAGDRFGFREAATALTRLRPRAAPPPEVWTTAACAGELGAAFGPVAIATAATFLHRNVVADPAVLVLGTSDRAPRGAAVVTKAAPPQPRSRR
jgi:3-oxoacyl-[acyl-carrier-protein] synthase-1